MQMRSAGQAWLGSARLFVAAVFAGLAHQSLNLWKTSSVIHVTPKASRVGLAEGNKHLAGISCPTWRSKGWDREGCQKALCLTCTLG